MINVQKMTIVVLQDATDQEQITARELVLFYLSRIAQTDQCEGGAGNLSCCTSKTRRPDR